jgi:NifB/MoaA-like Fe-S oxidoreductase
LKTGISFVYIADEFYGLAGYDLPPYETYDDFVQLENGVGLLRKFEHEFEEALSQMQPLQEKVKLNGVTGVAAYQFLSRLMHLLEPYGVEVHMHSVKNHFFGDESSMSSFIGHRAFAVPPLIHPHLAMRTSSSTGRQITADTLSL